MTGDDYDELIAIKELRDPSRRAALHWPFGADATYRLVRSGAVRAIIVGGGSFRPGRVFLTRRLIDEYLARNTVEGRKR